MKINNIHHHSQLSELNTIANRIVMIYGSFSIDDKHLQSLVSEIDALNTELLGAARRSKATSNSETEDKQRIKLIRALFKVVVGYEAMLDKELRKKAKQIKKVLDKYTLDNLTKKGRRDRNSLTASMLADLSDKKIRECIEQLYGLSAIVDELTKVQEKVIVTNLQYVSEKASYKSKPTATNLKPQLMDLINHKLKPYIVAMVNVDKDTYSSFALNIKNIIEDNNSAVKARGRQYKKKKGAE
ncbi:MAG: DUF6261 family protein [Bacteroidales bacterium]